MRLNGMKTIAGVIAVAVLGCAHAGVGVLGEEPIGLKVDQRVATRGAPVDLHARPLCDLAGDDADSQSRAVRFMTGFGIAVSESLAAVKIGPEFISWRGELKVVDHPAPASDESGGVRVVKSSPGLDVALVRALVRANLPALPNFRARCTFDIALRKAQQE
jgi:hypothetical protein